MLTSWDERCGIAEYSRRLVAALRERVEVEVVPATFLESPKAVYEAMGRALSQGEVVHVQHSYAFFGGMLPWKSGWSALLRPVRKPVLVTLHELDDRATGAYHLPAPVETTYKREFNRRTLLHPRVRSWMVHAERLRESLLSLGAAPDRVHYTPLPLEPPERPVDPEPLRRSLGLHGKRPLVILGFLSRRKGYDLALEALRDLPPEFVLVAAGGEHATDRSGTEPWLREEAKAAGVAERVRITGYLSEEGLEQAAALGEIVLAPFREMSASASIGYALAREKPVIASDLPENRKLGCVRLFPTGDAAALAAAVREVAGSPLRKRELAEAARRYSEAHGYEALAEETVLIYHSLAAEGAKG